MKRPLSARWSRVAAVAALTGCLLPGCSSCNDEPPPVENPKPTALAEVPAPEGLAAEIYVRDPDATWRSLRDLLAGPSGLLPSSAGMLVGTFLGLPGRAASAVDGSVPAVGAVIDLPKQGDERLGVVLGVHVRSGRELVADLTTGKHAAFSAKRDEATGIDLLVPVEGRDDDEPVTGVLGNYLLASPTEGALLAAGPYVARTLPKRPIPSAPISVIADQRALSGPIAKLLESEWKSYRKEIERADRENREKHGGRAPDFGDPAAAIEGLEGAVEGVLALLKSADRATLSVLPHPRRLEVRAELVPRRTGDASDLVSSMATGDALPLASLPEDTVAALLTRTHSEARAASSQSVFDALARLFADRLPAADQKVVRDALEALAQARGDHTVYALVSDPSLAVVTRGPAGDAEAVNRAMKGILDTFELRAFREPIRQFVGDVSIRRSTARVEGFERPVRRALIGVKPAPIPLRLGGGAGEVFQLDPIDVEVLWTVRKGELLGAAGTDAAPALARLARIDEQRTFGADPAFGEALRRAGEQNSFALAFRPGPAGVVDDPAAIRPVLVTVGRGVQNAVVRIEAPAAAIAALAREAL